MADNHQTKSALPFQRQLGLFVAAAVGIQWGVGAASTPRLPQAQLLEVEESASAAVEPLPCPLLQLSPEILSQILDQCPQQSRAWLARTASALYPHSMESLFRNVDLPKYDSGLSFRQACRKNPDRKNQIQHLTFPASRLWSEWFRYDSAITPMPALRGIEARYVPNVGLWEVLELASDTAPNVQRLCMAGVTLPGDPAQICIPALRRLHLESCYISSALLQSLARALPAVNTIYLSVGPGIGPGFIDEHGLKALSCFPRLTTLGIVGVLRQLQSESNYKRPFLEYPQLSAMFLMGSDSHERGTGLQVLGQVSMPRLQHMHITLGRPTDIDAIAKSLSSGFLPLLSVLDISYDSSKGLKTSGLFVLLRKAGFTFECLERAGRPGVMSHWEARRRNYKAKPCKPSS